jgi:hypothetical protein
MMRRVIHVESSEQGVRDLVDLLHQGAPAEEFARRLADVDALPASYPGKSALVESVRMAMAVRNRLELQQQRERGLLAVIDSAQDLSSRLDLQELLSAIVSRARNLLGADVAWLSTYDPDPASSTCWSPTARCRSAPRRWSRAATAASPASSCRRGCRSRRPTTCTTSASRTSRRSTTRSARKASPRWSACR